MRSLPVVGSDSSCDSDSSCGKGAGALCPISHTPCPGPCLFADVMESARLGIVVLDVRERALVFANASAREIFAAVQQPVGYRELIELLFPPGLDPASFTSPFSAEPLHLRSRVLGYTLYRSGSFTWAFVRDVTEKLRLESIAEAAELMNSIGFVFSALRHELGNPINSVKAALSVLRRGLDRFPRETVAEYLDRMLVEVGRVEHLLRSMKSFSMYERTEPTSVDLSAFLLDFEHLVRDEAERRGIRLELDTRDAVWASCDPRALQQVMLNLFANAADAMEGRDDASFRVELRSSGGLVTMRVIDNGPGLDAEQREHLFKPFYTSKAKGTGLGLVISRKLLAKMQGSIELDSAPGAGVAVTITLPACRECTGRGAPLLRSGGRAR